MPATGLSVGGVFQTLYLVDDLFGFKNRDRASLVGAGESRGFVELRILHIRIRKRTFAGVPANWAQASY